MPAVHTHRLHGAAPTALRVTTARSGDHAATTAELRTARAAVAKLPAADRALLAKHGLHVELVGRASLGDGMLGATNVVKVDDGPWTPTSIRVASHIHGRGPSSLAEVVQHELGHAVSVLRHQDRSEDAAEAYARRW
ncbi:MAG: hypothetical protein JWM98_419 [Thermoleophilia bacterium]|nr:hypothetical protein [Thermoleophilia bacterium]